MSALPVDILKDRAEKLKAGIADGERAEKSAERELSATREKLSEYRAALSAIEAAIAKIDGG